MKVRLRRDGLHIMWMEEQGDTLVYHHNRIPRFPRPYGQTIAAEPAAIAEDPEVPYKMLTMLVRNFADTDKALRAKGHKGLDPSTLRILRVEPDADHPNTLISWKASER